MSRLYCVIVVLFHSLFYRLNILDPPQQCMRACMFLFSSFDWWVTCTIFVTDSNTGGHPLFISLFEKVENSCRNQTLPFFVNALFQILFVLPHTCRNGGPLGGRLVCAKVTFFSWALSLGSSLSTCVGSHRTIKKGYSQCLREYFIWTLFGKMREFLFVVYKIITEEVITFQPESEQEASTGDSIITVCIDHPESRPSRNHSKPKSSLDGRECSLKSRRLGTIVW